MITDRLEDIAVYPLTSPLHNAAAVAAGTASFLGSLGLADCLRTPDFSDYGTHTLDLIYVRTGGTEALLQQLLPRLQQAAPNRPILLLAGNTDNSLPASLEILSYLRSCGIRGEVIHGPVKYMEARLRLLLHVARARQRLFGQRLAVVGAPSDWLIASNASAQDIQSRLGIELVHIPMAELERTISYGAVGSDATLEALAPTEAVRAAVPGATAIYNALRQLIEKYNLQGLTVRCFDLLSSVHNTGCVALARLGAEGFTAGCEGDIPTMLTLAVARAVAGTSAFQANPASIDPDNGTILLAHCTIPFDMVNRYELDTHFESGIGIGIRGFRDPGPVTVLKINGDASRLFTAEGTLEQCHGKPNLCRTQMTIRLDNPNDARYFLTDPIGNHHVVVGGHLAEVLHALLNV